MGKSGFINSLLSHCAHLGYPPVPPIVKRGRINLEGSLSWKAPCKWKFNYYETTSKGTPSFHLPYFASISAWESWQNEEDLLGNMAFRLRALLSARQHVLMVSMPVRPPHILNPVLTFPVVPPSLPAKAPCFQLLKNCSCFCPLSQYMVGGVDKERIWLADLQFRRVQGRGMPWFPLHCQQTEKPQV